MKLNTLALAVCGALAIGVPGIPANVQAVSEQSEIIKNGETFYFELACTTEENGNPTCIYLNIETGIVGNTAVVDLPELPGYRFKEVASTAATGVIRVEGSKLYLDAAVDGMMRFPWEQKGTNICYNPGVSLRYEKDPEFQLVPGWNQMACSSKVGVAWFYCNEDLSFKTGLQTIDGKLYYFFEDGRMAESEMVVMDDDYSEAFFFGSSGALKTGWIRQMYGQDAMIGVKEIWYYGDPETGYLKHNTWLEENGRYYYFNNFTMAESTWVDEGGERYYVTNSGAMATSRWIHYQGNDYYVDETGKMLKNQWVGQYWVDENGVWDQTKTR